MKRHAEDPGDLGLKQLQSYPWEDVEKKYPEGSIVRGRVVSITNYGAFVELERGVEGLIHISELSHQRVAHPGDVVHEGQTLITLDDREIRLELAQHRANLKEHEAELRSIEIEQFVPARREDPGARFVKQSYYLEPEPVGRKAFALLKTVLAESERAHLDHARRGLVAGQEDRAARRRGAAGVHEEVLEAQSAAGGEVVAVNEDLRANPSMANQDPYAAWMVQLKPENWDSVKSALTAGADVAGPYEAKMDSEGVEGCG